jgi:hypothetical protein
MKQCSSQTPLLLWTGEKLAGISWLRFFLIRPPVTLPGLRLHSSSTKVSWWLWDIPTSIYRPSTWLSAPPSRRPAWTPVQEGTRMMPCPWLLAKGSPAKTTSPSRMAITGSSTPRSVPPTAWSPRRPSLSTSATPIWLLYKCVRLSPMSRSRLSCTSISGFCTMGVGSTQDALPKI